MSLPPTPAAEDDEDAFFWKGELAHVYLVFWWLISAMFPRPRPRPFSRTTACFRYVPGALYTPKPSEW